MSYNYQAQKPRLFTDAGQRREFLAIRDKAEKCLKFAGAVRSQELMCVTGNSWDMLACIDRLIELNYNTESCPIKGVCLEHSAKGLVFMSTKLLVVAVGRRFRNETMEAILTDYPQLTERHVWFAAGYVTGQYVGEEKMIWG